MKKLLAVNVWNYYEVVDTETGEYHEYSKEQLREVLKTEKIEGISGKERIKANPIDYHTLVDEGNEYIPFEVLKLFNHLLVEVGEFGYEDILEVIESYANGGRKNPYSMSRGDYINSLIKDCEDNRGNITPSELGAAFKCSDTEYGRVFSLMQDMSNQGSNETKWNNLLEMCGLPSFFIGMAKRKLFAIK